MEQVECQRGFEKWEGHHASNISWNLPSHFMYPSLHILPFPSPPYGIGRLFPRISWIHTHTHDGEPLLTERETRGRYEKTPVMEISETFKKSSEIFDLQESFPPPSFSCSFRYNVATPACGHFEKAEESLKRGKWGKKWLGMASQPERQRDVFLQCIKSSQRIVPVDPREIWSSRNRNSME